MADLSAVVARPLSGGVDGSVCGGDVNAGDEELSAVCDPLPGGVATSSAQSESQEGGSESGEEKEQLEGVKDSPRGGRVKISDGQELRRKTPSEFQKELRRSLVVLGMLEMKAEDEVAAASQRPLFSFESVETLGARQAAGDSFFGSSPSRSLNTSLNSQPTSQPIPLWGGGLRSWRQRQNEALKRQLMRQKSEQGNLLELMTAQEVRLLSEQRERRRQWEQDFSTESLTSHIEGYNGATRNVSPLSLSCLSETSRIARPSPHFHEDICTGEQRPLFVVDNQFSSNGRGCGNESFGKDVFFSPSSPAAFPVTSVNSPLRSHPSSPPMYRQLEHPSCERAVRQGEYGDSFVCNLGVPPSLPMHVQQQPSLKLPVASHVRRVQSTVPRQTLGRSFLEGPVCLSPPVYQELSPPHPHLPASPFLPHGRTFPVPMFRSGLEAPPPHMQGLNGALCCGASVSSLFANGASCSVPPAHSLPYQTIISPRRAHIGLQTLRRPAVSSVRRSEQSPPPVASAPAAISSSFNTATNWGELFMERARVEASRNRALLFRAISSLYEDCLMPEEILIKNRLLELSCNDFVAANFMALYGLLSGTYSVVRSKQSGIQVVLLKETPASHLGFVKVEAPQEEDEHEFNCEFWAELQEELRGMAVDETSSLAASSLVAGRYAVARLLQRRNLPVLSGFSLGRICRVVHLAFLKGMMVFDQDGLRPAVLSQRPAEAASSQLSQHRLPEGVAPTDVVSSVEELRDIMLSLLTETPEGFSLSTLKRHIKLRFGKDLCQSVFSCSKLSDVMLIPEIRAVCKTEKIFGRASSEGSFNYAFSEKGKGNKRAAPSASTRREALRTEEDDQDEGDSQCPQNACIEIHVGGVEMSSQGKAERGNSALGERGL